MKKVKLHIIAVTILLLAYSRLLFSQIPVYVSSFVEDASPSVIEMTFSTSLANIVPDPSAFVARVNTDTKGINTISISGSKVSLTLVEPIIYFGDVVTIDYIIPTQNPLQALSGEQVASFNLQPVINHCLEKDIDGNTYNIVEIGRQIWMGENLKVTTFRDTKPINFASDNTTWANFETQTTNGYCWYDDIPANKNIYGALYNWYAVATGNLCPSGWHVPSDDEWKTLEICLGMSQADADLGGSLRGTNEGGKLKETGLTHWTSPNTGATNESKFTALGAGERAQDLRGFFWLKNETYFWTTSFDNPYYPWIRRLMYSNGQSGRFQADKNSGFSVRCLSNFLKPTLATLPASNIQANSATSGGTDIDEDGQPIAVRGVCWSTSHNPTILDSHTIDGSGRTNFTSTLTGLTPNTPYYARAFTFNYVGTSYGNEISFTTLQPPTVVTNTSDYDPTQGEASIYGSLRSAIEYANSNPGNDLITFNIPGSGLHTIVPSTPLPIITEPIVIDGYSQPETTRATSTTPANLLIELDGGLGIPIGLNILSGNSEIRGLIINSFNEIDIQVLGPNGGNTIEGNYIGIDAGGDAKGTNVIGIRIDKSPDNTIGGDNPENRNIIAASGGLEGANCLVYIDFPQSTGNVVKGNYLGVGPDGSTKSGESIVGVRINAGAHDNTIGPYNVISGNSLAGIQMEPGADNFSNHNQIIGNFIGTNKNGTGRVPNGYGIRIFNGPANTIGGATTEDRNIISGNLQAGIEVIFDSNDALSENIIIGNYIGVDAQGTNALGNGGIGISINSKNNTIGGAQPSQANVISGNNNFGILLNGPSASGNQILGNLIGTNSIGTTLLSNRDDGINITGAPENLISGNLICGAGIGGVGNNGIEILDITAAKNVISGNFIGINAQNTTGLGNGFNGIQIKRNAHDNTFGPNNVISGNLGHGILIESDTQLGGISANSNIIVGNFIGTSTDGKTAVGNSWSGVTIRDKACNNTIGSGNIISGNHQGGVKIMESGTEGNKIIGNYIGLDISGKIILGNGKDAIEINSASNNIIGGSIPSERNVIVASEISGAAVWINSNGASSNVIKGNYIGLDASGTIGLGNEGSGININLGATNNTLGGVNPGEGNVISGFNEDHSISVQISGLGTDGNKVFGNYIGTDFSGENKIGNHVGIFISDGASNNQIGEVFPSGKSNLIAYSEIEGVLLIGNNSKGNAIMSNSIYSNGRLGIDLGYDGVTLNDPGDSDPGPNNLQNFPEIESVSFKPGYVTISGSINSEANKKYTLQFFANKVADESKYGEGQTYLYLESETQQPIPIEVTTDGNGNAPFTITLPIKGIYGQVITATATDPAGNTSEFSKFVGGLSDQVVGMNWPVRYVYNPVGAEKITDGTDITAIKNSFDAWSNISTAKTKFVVSEGSADMVNAVAGDGINLVSFLDTEYDWPEGVLAYASKTTEMDEGGTNGKITDADIIVNPAFKDVLVGTTGLAGEVGTPGFYDIQSIITHEIGHTLGLLHSGLTRSTMFFWMNKGSIGKRTLESDDIAWAGYKYPQSTYSSTFGTITGNIQYGYKQPNTSVPVAGALVTAENAQTGISFHSYSDADGNYTIPVLSGSKQYYIHIQPLDGDVGGYPMTPANISSYIYSNTIYTDYPEEYFNINDNDGGNDPAKLTDNETNKDPVSVSGVANIITNRDITPPQVVSVTPDNGSIVKVLPDIIITFSEPVDLTSFSDASCFLQNETGPKYYGSASQWDGNTLSVIFTPDQNLPNSALLTLHLKGITDLKGNALASEYQAYSVTTIAADHEAPRITSYIPLPGASGVFLKDAILINFSESMNKSSVESSFSLKLLDGTDIEGSGSWNSGGTLFTFTPSPNLSEDKTYEVSFTGPITDLSGNAMVPVTSYKFYTIASAPPEINDIEPGFELKEVVSVTTPIMVDFSEPIDVSSINCSTCQTFTLQEYLGTQANGDPSYGNPIPGKFEFLNNNSRVIFRPDEDLKPSQSGAPKQYRILLTTGIMDVSQPTAMHIQNNESATFTTAIQPSGPSITYIEKPTGVIGDEVIISGNGFDPDPAKNLVSFAGTTAPVKQATLTSVNVVVPTGTVSGEVTVSVKGSTSAGFFFYIVKPSNVLPDDWGTSNSNLGNGTHSTALNGDCTLAFVTNSGSNDVSVVGIDDEGNLNLLYDIPVGEIPMDIAINSTDTRAYVTNYGSNTVSVIDLTTASHEKDDNDVDVKEINVGINPYGVAVVPDGNYVYVANYTSQNLSGIDVNPNSGGFDHATTSVDLKSGGKGTAVTGDAGLVLVATDDGLKIVNINPDSKELCFNCVATSSSNTKITKVDVTGDAGYAIATTEDGRILLIDVLPGSDYFGTAVSSTTSSSPVTSARNAGDGLHIYATTENHDLLIFEITPGGVGVPGVEGSYTGTVGLKLVGKKPSIGNDAAVVDALNQRLFTADSKLNSSGSSVGTLYSTGLYVPPQAPQDRIAGLIQNVQELMYGSLKRSIGNGLISCLNSAINYINVKKNKDAINKLNTFIVNLKDMIKSQRNLTPDEKDKAQDMINTAYEIIAQLKGIKSADEESTISGVNTQSNQDVISQTRLGLIYPNPTKEAITINYEVAEDELNSGKVTIQIFDISGKLVGNLVNRTHEPGRYSVSWNGYYENGGLAPRGIYYIRFTAGNIKEVKQIMLVR